MSNEPKNPVIFDPTIHLDDGWTLRKYPISGEWALHDETGAHIHWMTTRAARMVEATYAAGLLKGAETVAEHTRTMTGRIPTTQPQLQDFPPKPKLKGCRACFGSGGKRLAPCDVCNGSGKVPG